MDCSQGFSERAAEVAALNSKLGYDAVAQLQLQAQLDNQTHARAMNAIQTRRAENAATIDHAINAGLVLAGQVGTTEGQQTVNPIRTGTADATVGGVGVAAEQVATNVPALGDLVVKFAELVSAFVAQSQPKS